ncbi:MAG: hypothetical protein SCH39_04630 [Methanosarcinales archaeon]|nr:hypothetical protein [ANME-2 cluster archaeon]MDF1531587.1 hypothetical protein [ANME-2 cluster archaeon]MDW7775611.1 hypothetical protein [Methanosarcinales archaeon]
MVNNNGYITKGNSKHEVMNMSEGFGYKKDSMFARISLRSKYNFVYDVVRYLKIGTVLASTIVIIYVSSWAATVGMTYLVKMVP